MFPAPWSPRKQLLRIGIKAAQPPPGKRPPANIVFLIDVSGSMSSRDKLPLAKASVCMLLHKLNPRDRVALVVYAGAAGTKLKPTPAHERAKVLAALDDLESGGSTAGGEGIRLAYSLAEKSFRKDGVNRIVLATDGDFNVGIHEPRRLRDFVSRKRKTGVFLYGNRHYLLAYDEGARDYRKFALPNVEEVNGTGDYFERDEGFSIEEYAEASFGVYSEDPFDVVWKFSPEIAGDVKQYSFHPQQIMKQEEDGSVLVEFRAGGILEMAWHLYKWGHHVEVIKPRELAEIVHPNRMTWEGQI